MDKKIIKFDGTEIEEYKFHHYKSPILINNIDINKIVVSNKFIFDKQDFKYFIGYKDNKEIRPLCIFFLEMIINKRYSNKNKCMYFMIKHEKSLDKYMIVLEKVSNITKKIIYNKLIYNKFYLKAEEKFNIKDGFHCFYIPVILFDSIYVNSGNYYPKMFFVKLFITFFWKNVISFDFLGFGSAS